MGHKSLRHLLAASAFFAAIPAFAEGSLIQEQLGKFHFLVLHFPVVLVTLLPVVVLASLTSFGSFWKRTIPYFVHLGTLSAIGTSLFGFFELSMRSTVSPSLQWHQYGGYAVTTYMTIFSLLLLWKRPNLEKRIPAALVVASLFAALLITVTAHLGGESVHGSLFILLGGE